MKATRKLLYLALFTAQSLALFLFEGLIPLPFTVPGAKLGLANVITVTALYYFPQAKDVFIIVLMRTVLASFFGGGPTVWLFSVTGGFFSLAVMALLKAGGRFSLPTVSAAGGFAHNLAQLAVAYFLLDAPGLWLYFPLLGIAGLGTGLLIGIATMGVLKKIPPWRGEK
ncbi:MAG: Gx transporter family protein [Selenomonadaceae bacterium]|nr:Gx transporter family protein [Selenomonadaceae bacterium]